MNASMPRASSDPARNSASGLTRAEEDRLAEKLVQLRDELRSRHENHLAPSREGDGEEPDPMDRAAIAQDHAISLEIAEHERDRLAEIEEALERIEEGTYGVCEGTGEPIGWKRLEAQPWTRFSIRHMEMLEHDEADARRRHGV